MSVRFSVPGVYPDDTSPSVDLEFRTGVPVFLGYAGEPAARAGHDLLSWSSAAVKLTAWSDFQIACGEPRSDGYLGAAIRGFFENGGRLCYVLRLDDRAGFTDAIEAALQILKGTDHVDLVCVPDAAMLGPEALSVQRLVLSEIEAEHRFALFDSLPDAGLVDTVTQWQALSGRNGALYYPWVVVSQRDGKRRHVPPCGHVAGVFARTDRETGVFKAPANEVVEGVWDLQVRLSDSDQRDMDPHGVVNCLRAFPGRGIRIWGARTLSGEAAWRSVSVRRLFLTTARWVEWQMADIVMEPNNAWLWARIRRELNDYLFKLFRRGVLKGETPQEAYFIKCDGETTSAASRERGEVCVEIGLAPVVPAEFISVRLVCGAGGVQMTAGGSNA